MEQEQQPPKRQRSSQQMQGAAHPRVPCARCGSGDTKFCYYNNYNTSQPRYYCRTCKRHWTHGGNLRNVPEGAGSSKKTKNKKPSSSASLKLPRPQFQTPVMTAGIGNLDRGPVLLPTFFYGGGSGGRPGGGMIGGDELGLINPGGVLGDFGQANPALAPLPRFDPLDGVNLQQLVQQPRLSLALHQNLLMFQHHQGSNNWRQNPPPTIPPPFTTAAPSSVAPSSSSRAADITEEITHRRNNNNNNNNAFNLPPPPPPPSSSFM